MTTSLSLQMTSGDSHERLTDAVEGFVSTHDLPPRAAYLIDLVLEEIVTNIVNHGAKNRAAKIDVRLSRVGERVIGSVRDDTAPFDPLSRGPADIAADIDERAIGGLGIHLVREMTESVAYAREDGHNVLTFSIDLKKETP